MKFLIALLILTAAKAYSAPVVATQVAGKCKKTMLAAATKYVGTDNYGIGEEYDFQGFNEEGFSTGPSIPNLFIISYSFNGECQGEANLRITPTKTVTKDGEVVATECKVIELSDGAGDCG